jgi:hypothetical protein
MSDINLKDLFDQNINGADLFDDKENFMIEISEDNEQIVGGMKSTLPTTCDFTDCHSASEI